MTTVTDAELGMQKMAETCEAIKKEILERKGEFKVEEEVRIFFENVEFEHVLTRAVDLWYFYSCIFPASTDMDLQNYVGVLL